MCHICVCERRYRHVCHICKLRILCLKRKKHYLGVRDVVGECARTDVPAHYFFSSLRLCVLWGGGGGEGAFLFFLGVCVHMYHVFSSFFSFLIQLGACVFLCGHVCQEFLFRGRRFWRVHVCT